MTGGLGAAAAPLLLGLFSLLLVAFAGAKPEVTADSDAISARRLSLLAGLLGATVLTGFGVSHYHWGGFIVADPKLFFCLIALGLCALHSFVLSSLPHWERTPDLLGLLVFVVLAWSLVGPELGWTAPTLHRFGG